MIWCAIILELSNNRNFYDHTKLSKVGFLETIPRYFRTEWSISVK